MKALGSTGVPELLSYWAFFPGLFCLFFAIGGGALFCSALAGLGGFSTLEDFPKARRRSNLIFLSSTTFAGTVFARDGGYISE